MSNLITRNNLTRLFIFPWHTLLLALYVPVNLGAYNIGQIPVSAIYRSVILSGICALILLWAFHAILRDWQTAGLAATLIVSLFLTYGHVYAYARNFEIDGFLIGRHRYLAALWGVFAVAGLGWVTRKSQKHTTLTSTLNLVGLFLLVMPVAQLIWYHVRAARYQDPNIVEAVPQPYNRVEKPSGGQLHDVYYIILDAYGRSDVLLDALGYDNSAFLGKLDDMGFYVASCAQSNYSITVLSLSSTLNMDYLTALDPSLTPDNTDRLPMSNLTKNNAVTKTFQGLGYTTMAFETGFDFTELNNIDVFYRAERQGFNEFETLYLRTTFAVLMDDAGIFARFQIAPEDRKRELVLFNLEKLREIASIPGPKFVFVHLVIPHPPFVFGPHGERLIFPERIKKGNNTSYSIQDYVAGYRNQAIFIGDQIAGVAESILQNSSVSPIIIIQGDHGPGHFGQAERMGILNAYFFPGSHAGLYPTLTPVNTFRLLFNTYFQGDFELLEDVSYFSERSHIYRYEIVPNQCQVDFQ